VDRVAASPFLFPSPYESKQFSGTLEISFDARVANELRPPPAVGFALQPMRVWFNLQGHQVVVFIQTLLRTDSSIW
jgi:hypothetical protein